MKKFRTVTEKVKQSYTICDQCKGRVTEYGGDHFTLHSIVEPFRDDGGESTTYDFCSFKCLKEFINTHKQQDVICSELVHTSWTPP